MVGAAPKEDTPLKRARVPLVTGDVRSSDVAVAVVDGAPAPVEDRQPFYACYLRCCTTAADEKESWPLAGASAAVGSGSRRCPGSYDLFWILPPLVSALFLIIGNATVGLDRVGQHGWLSFTALWASMIAGSSPEGGGSVFFPVLTDIFHTTPAVGRTFRLAIQTVGMGMASLRILSARTTVDWRVVGLVLTPALISEAVILTAGSARELPFWPPDLFSGPWVSVTFALLLVSMAVLSVMMLYTADVEAMYPLVTPWNVRRGTTLVVVGVLGGVFSALIGNGANVLTYLVLFCGFDVRPSTAVPTTILITAALSIEGFMILGIYGKQFDVVIDEANRTVLSIGDIPTTFNGTANGTLPCETQACDLPALFLAAAPVVALGGPLGASLMRRYFTEFYLVTFVTTIACASVIGTFCVLPDLHRGTPLLAYALSGLVVCPAVVLLVRTFRYTLFGRSDAESLPGGATSSSSK